MYNYESSGEKRKWIQATAKSRGRFPSRSGSCKMEASMKSWLHRLKHAVYDGNPVDVPRKIPGCLVLSQGHHPDFWTFKYQNRVRIWQTWKISQLEIAQRGHSLSLCSMYLCMLAERQLGVYICLQLHSNHGDCGYTMAKNYTNNKPCHY